jgi:tripartite-type tricarboxylate transporter receptor subunit TctC
MSFAFSERKSTPRLGVDEDIIADPFILTALEAAMTDRSTCFDPLASSVSSPTSGRRHLLQGAAGLAVAGSIGLATGMARAQAWPGKPVRLIVTFPPGGSSDIVARLIAPSLGAALGQPVIVDNKPGAGATIGAAEVARAAPDGYTFMLSNTAPISLSPFMLDKSPYDPVASFSHVAYIGSVANCFVVHPSVPAKTLPEFIAWANQQKDPVNYGSGGVGSIGHIIGEMLKSQAGIRLEHVGYKGSAPMHNDLVGGTIKFAIDTLPQNIPFIQAGKLRGLAVTSPTRAAMAPDLPSVSEIGLGKLVAENFFGISGPAGLSAGIVEAMHRHVSAALKEPRVIKTLEDGGIATRVMSVAEFKAFVARQVADWGPAVKASGAKLG